MNFEELIYNKNVIFTCPSSILVNSKMGSYIDNFDTVIRINNFFNINNEIDFGKRIDILYINKAFSVQYEKFPIEEWKLKGLKFLCYKSNLQYNYDNYIQTRSFSYIFKELLNVKGLLTGTMVIKDLLNFKPKKLVISGMNFYNNVTNNSYYINNYKKIEDEPLKGVDLENQTDDVIHNIKSNKKYVLNLYKEKLIDFCLITKKALKEAFN